MTAGVSQHVPVLLAEVLDGLAPRPGGTYIDGTVGGGGHAAAIIGSAPSSRVLGLDRDPDALDRARLALAPFGDRVTLVRASFAEIATVARRHGHSPCDGIVLDLGVSSDQLNARERGFSFQHEGPLDMRLDPSSPRTAADLVNLLSERELADLLYTYGEERRSRQVARAIVAARPVETTTELAAVIARAVARRPGGHHPATRSFQALRIVVNDELAALRASLPEAISLLTPGGRLAVVSFHSLEDRIVKQFFRDEARACLCPPELPECRCDHCATVRLANRRPIVPSPAEVTANPRARSARLRVAERLPLADSDPVELAG